MRTEIGDATSIGTGLMVISTSAVFVRRRQVLPWKWEGWVTKTLEPGPASNDGTSAAELFSARAIPASAERSYAVLRQDERTESATRGCAMTVAQIPRAAVVTQSRAIPVAMSDDLCA